jgi:histidinol-phosphatase (PHP family)
VEAVAESGVAIEINTAGLYKDVAEIYPAPLFLELACQAGVPLTINSDAHAPEEVARAFWGAMTLARSVGYKEIVRFEGRKRKVIPLP